jgi:hypothetical protein
LELGANAILVFSGNRLNGEFTNANMPIFNPRQVRKSPNVFEADHSNEYFNSSLRIFANCAPARAIHLACAASAQQMFDLVLLQDLPYHFSRLS